jgi:predicted RNase H-like nuclease (RuvC/YqgF family)
MKEEGTVTISLERYNDLIKCEKALEENAYLFAYDRNSILRVFGKKDDAIKELEEKNKSLYEVISTLKYELDELRSRIRRMIREKEEPKKELKRKSFWSL